MDGGKDGSPFGSDTNTSALDRPWTIAFARKGANVAIVCFLWVR
jgi:hypothetical protein